MIPKFSKNSIDSITFLVDFALRNEACLLDNSFTANWPAIHEWQMEDGRPNLDVLIDSFGNADVPVLVGEASDYDTMKFHDFILRYVEPTKRKTIAYLKDWHFQSQFAELAAHVYLLPAFLAMDWLNGEKWTQNAKNFVGGDYRFFYFGTAGSWTKFHADVMDSYSWSANVCGRKLWYLLRRGTEKHFAKYFERDGQNCFVEDIRDCSPEIWKKAGVIEFVQEPGEIVFVPSGWYHQVHNLEDSISLNHNVINACNVNFLRTLVASRLRDVQHEIADLRDELSPQEFASECQKILLADNRMNEPVLTIFMDLIINSRSSSQHLLNNGNRIFSLSQDYEEVLTRVAHSLDGCVPNLHDLDVLKRFLRHNCYCNQMEAEDRNSACTAKMCDNCAQFWCAFELERARAVKNSLKNCV